MRDKRATGSYYTPSIISDFVVRRTFDKCNDLDLAVLEPSAGEGAFVRSIYSVYSHEGAKVLTTAIEINPPACEKIKSIDTKQCLTVIAADFLEYQDQHQHKQFDIIIGNPPYIKSNLLSARQIEYCRTINSRFEELNSCQVRNIWVAFLVRAMTLVKSTGIISFVLPAELLQVKYTDKIRSLLISHFKRIEIFTFNELIFSECKGQDTVILIAEKKSNSPGLFFCNVKNSDELKCGKFSFTNMSPPPQSKWTSHCLTLSEIALIDDLKSRLLTMDFYCNSKAGIVTGANKYFILNESFVNDNNLHLFVKPVIQKGSFVKTWIKFDLNDFSNLKSNQSPCFLLDLNGQDIINAPGLYEYLSSGEVLGIPLRHKAKARNKWYEIPGIGSCPQALFFKRCHVFPKFVINEAAVLATDSAYVVNAKDGVDIKSLVLSFYNSLTLVLSELLGRFYGGGVLELTPNEFRSIPVPYLKISDSDYAALLGAIDSCDLGYSSINVIDNFFLKKAIPEITDSEIELLGLIHRKLVARRQRL